MQNARTYIETEQSMEKQVHVQLIARRRPKTVNKNNVTTNWSLGESRSDSCVHQLFVRWGSQKIETYENTSPPRRLPCPSQYPDLRPLNVHRHI